MISKIKKPVSILLALMMVVSLFTIVPLTASAEDYVDSSVWLGNLAAGDTLSANNGETYIECQEYSVILKGGTYRERSYSEPQADDTKFQEEQVQMMYLIHEGNAQLLFVWTVDDEKQYYPLDAEGNPSDKWYVLSNENNTVTLGGHVPAPATYVAQIGTTGYETLEAAIAAAQAGDTVKLLDTVTLTESLVIPEGKDFTLDLNGKDITGNVNDKLVKNNGTVVVDDSTAAPGHIYNTNIDKQGNAAFVNYGTATVKNGYFGDKNSDQTDANDVNRGAGFQNYGTAVINGGYFTACDNFTNTADTGIGYAYAIINYGTLTVNDATVYGKNNGNLANNEGTMTVNGGNYTLNKPAKKSVYYSIYNGSADANTIVNAGTFTNNGTKALLYTLEGSTEIKGGTFTGPKIEQSTGAPAISGGTFNKAVPEEYCVEGYLPVTNTDGTYTVGGPYVAKIGSTGYATLSDALDAAQDGDTVKLLADINDTSVYYHGEGDNRAYFIIGKKNLTLDGNNHTVTLGKRGFGVKYTGSGEGANITFKDITIINNESGGRAIDTRGSNLASITLDNATLNCTAGNYSQALTIGGNQATVVNVNIINGSSISDEQYYAITTFNPVNMKIEDSTITGWACIYAKGPAGSAGSAGSTFTVKNSKLNSANHNSGTSNSFSAIMLEDDNITVNITDTKINISNDSDTVKQSIVSYQANANLTGNSVNLGSGNDVTFTGVNADFTTNNAPLTVSGGTFNEAVPEAYCADGYIPKDNGDGTYGVKTGAYVAQVNGVKYETLEAAFAAASDGDTITLLADCSGNGIKAPQGKFATGLTVDFGGYTYTVDGDTVGSTGTETNGFQLLKDNKITFKNGTITSEKAKILVQNYSNLTLDGMTLTLNNTGYNGAYTLSNNNGDVVINNTTINANPTTGSFAFDVCRYSSYPSVNVTVKGDSHINGNVEVFASKSDPKNGFSLKLEGGDMSGDIVLDQTAKNVLEANPDKLSVTKAAGFNQAAPEGYVWVDTATAGVQTLAKAVAKIGTTNYATLEAAFAAAQDGETITLLADCAGNGIKAPQGKFATGLTVDFDGHTYTVDGATVGSTGTETNGFQLLKDNKITFKNGTITSEKAKILVQNYSNLTLDGMTLTLNNTGYNGAYTLSNNNGDVVINNTTINANPTTGSFAFDVCRYSSYPSVNVTVKGDSHINGNVEVFASKSDPKNGFSLKLEGGDMSGDIVLDQTAKNVLEANPDKLSVTKAAGFNQAAPEGYVWVDTATAGVQTLAKAVAKIGTTNYATLEAAFAAAQDGETITLLADCAGNGIKAPQGKFATGLTVDFDGHTYTVDGATVGSTGTETNGFQLLKDNKITFKNGTITSEKAKILVQNYSNLTLDGMTLTLNNTGYNGAYTLSNNNGDVVINNTTINANPAGGFAFDVCRYSSYPSVNVTVTGNSKINGNVEVSASGNDAKDGFSLNLNGGTMTGDIVVDASAKNLINNGGTVNKADAFTKAAPEGFVWVDSATTGVQTLAKAVAKIGTTNYATLEAAFAAAQDGDTITLLADCAGNGIQVLPNRFNTNGLTVDFDGHTYNVDGTTVGSTGTKTQAFQLQKNNKITFKGGTITSTKALMLVQNYSDLTLKDMTLDGSNLIGNNRYTLSNNNGNVVIDGSTITAKAGEGNYAFDVCRYSSYPSVNVTVTGNSKINGNVEVSASKSDPKDGFSLNLNGGTMTGAIVLAPSAKAAMEKAPDKVSVNKATTFDKAAPEGYQWVASGEGKQTLAKIVKLFTAHSITLNGDIELNFYINPEYANFDDASSAYVKFSWDDEYTAEVDLKNMVPGDDGYKASVKLVAAQMANAVHAEVYLNDEKIGEENYTVREYAEELYNHPEKYDSVKDDELKALAQALLNYGATAQIVFNDDLNVHPADLANANLDENDKEAYKSVNAAQIGNAIPEQASNMEEIGTKLGGKFYTSSVIYLNQNKLRLYFTPNTYPEGTLPYGDKYKIVEGYYYYVESEAIPAAKLDQQQHFEVGGVEFHYSALDYAKAVVESNMGPEAKNLAKALFCYYQAAKAYIG